MWFPDRGEVHPPEVAGATTNSYSSEKVRFREGRHVELFHASRFPSCGWFLSLIACFKLWNSKYNCSKIVTMHCLEIPLSDPRLEAVWTYMIKVRDVGVVPELVPDSPRKLFLKEENINLMISIGRSRDVAF